MTTYNVYTADPLEASRQQFARLSPSRRNALARKAKAFIGSNPGCADNNGFWERLSARQVTEEAHHAAAVASYRRDSCRA
jgi:hypothetical protein